VQKAGDIIDIGGVESFKQYYIIMSRGHT